MHSVRYKPRDNVVVQYSVQTARGWSTAVAYACAGVGLEPKETAGATAGWPPGSMGGPRPGNRSRTSPRCPRSCSGCRSTSGCRS